MHLQQTKVGSRKSGGPQYYFHDLPDAIKAHLRHRGVCPVVLQTPYGIAASSFMAVGCDHKLGANGRALKGRVGHDRIQQSVTAAESIGESIRTWYGLPCACDFERIDVEVSIHPEGHFILAPLRASLRGRKRSIELVKPVNPLSFTHYSQSRLWCDQIRAVLKQPDQIRWIVQQIDNVVQPHQRADYKNIHEADLLRISGAFSKLGVALGPYLVKMSTAIRRNFNFCNFRLTRARLKSKSARATFPTKFYDINPYRAPWFFVWNTISSTSPSTST
jgi:hypothetical protein